MKNLDTSKVWELWQAYRFGNKREEFADEVYKLLPDLLEERNQYEQLEQKMGKYEKTLQELADIICFCNDIDGICSGCIAHMVLKEELKINE